jgi:hypothetical protein
MKITQLIDDPLEPTSSILSVTSDEVEGAEYFAAYSGDRILVWATDHGKGGWEHQGEEVVGAASLAEALGYYAGYCDALATEDQE